jgi:hypothetical protein
VKHLHSILKLHQDGQLQDHFDASQAAFSPDAFMAAAINLAVPDPNTTGPAAKYNKRRKYLRINSDDEIFGYIHNSY